MKLTQSAPWVTIALCSFCIQALQHISFLSSFLHDDDFEKMHIIKLTK